MFSPVCAACPSQLIFFNYLKITSFEKDGWIKIMFTLIAKHVCHTKSSNVPLIYEVLKAMHISCKVHRGLATYSFVDGQYRFGRTCFLHLKYIRASVACSSRSSNSVTNKAVTYLMCYRTGQTHKATEKSQHCCRAYFNCDCTAMHITYWDSLLLYWVIFLRWNIKWTYGSVDAKESVWRLKCIDHDLLHANQSFNFVNKHSFYLSSCLFSNGTKKISNFQMCVPNTICSLRGQT